MPTAESMPDLVPDQEGRSDGHNRVIARTSRPNSTSPSAAKLQRRMNTRKISHACLLRIHITKKISILSIARTNPLVRAFSTMVRIYTVFFSHNARFLDLGLDSADSHLRL